MGGAEVLDHYKGHAGIGWYCCKELLKGSQASGGSANSYNGEVIGWFIFRIVRVGGWLQGRFGFSWLILIEMLRFI
jgi:hypothetical protein